MKSIFFTGNGELSDMERAIVRDAVASKTAKIYRSITMRPSMLPAFRSANT